MFGRWGFRGCVFPQILGGQPGASPTPSNSHRGSERAFVEAEVGYALQLASRSWELSRWPRGFRRGVGRRSSLLGNGILRKWKSIDKRGKNRT